MRASVESKNVIPVIVSVSVINMAIIHAKVNTKEAITNSLQEDVTVTT